MRKIISSMYEFLENGGTWQGYYDQFNTVKALNVGERYVMMPNDWMQSIIEILYIGHGVALGVEIESCATKAKSKGRKVMFIAEGAATGWVYNENRYQYRLQELNTIKSK